MDVMMNDANEELNEILSTIMPPRTHEFRFNNFDSNSPLDLSLVVRRYNNETDLNSINESGDRVIISEVSEYFPHRPSSCTPINTSSIIMADQLSHRAPPASPPLMKTEPIERPESPEANCAICLEDFTNRSYTDSCYHEFCFVCLREWAKIKPECPLCKQRFTTIIHNVRSTQEYDEYHVGVHPSAAANLNPAQSLLLNLAFRDPITSYHQPSYRNTLAYRAIVEDSMFRRQHSALNLSPAPLLYIHHQPPLIRAQEPPEIPTYDDVGRMRNRREVYRHNRWVRPSISSRIRESSPEFYRLNPATTHRLVPWLMRELNVLLPIDSDVHAFCQEIMQLITVYPLRSRQFRERMRTVMGDRADHFIHEFYNFAVSPHEMGYYDVVCEYEPPGTRPYPFATRGEASDSDSDVEVVRVMPKVLCVPNEPSTGLDLSNRAGPSSATARPASPIVIEILDSSSSDDEVEIVSVRATTPETIIIDETDSDAEITFPSVPNGSSRPRSDNPNHSPRSGSSDRMRAMLATIDDELIGEQTPSPFIASRSPTPPMPYLRAAIGSKEPSSPNPSESSSTYASLALPSPSSTSSSSSLSSSSDSNYSEYMKRRPLKKRKKISRKRTEKPKKRPKKSPFSDSSSDEEYQPKSSRPRLRSVVVKPEPTRRSHRNSHFIFPTDSD